MRSSILLLGCVLLAACTSGTEIEPTGTAIELTIDESFVLAPGETAVIAARNMEITFVEVPEDSRCPEDAVCVWAGNALVQLEVVRDGVELAIGLNTTEGPESAPVADNLELALEGLGPMPTTPGPIDKGDYRATLRLRSIDGD